jgi:DNA invertase Pin-like site-specific DNA recombinase
LTFERQLIIERTRAGLAAARARGKKGGRPKLLNEKERDVAVRLYNDRKNSIMEICQLLKISKPTLYNYLHQANNH